MTCGISCCINKYGGLSFQKRVVRSGINSIDKGQFEAAHALGMGHLKTMIYV